ncbi:hypothetical protein GLOIN_2v1766447 [Rhizophagus irregularis DAOM 181602=DAOM 197198]|uniref:Uncharacterized protein n=1 Tax=Rhizophagus irregularis (strain DAOM 181602 / DAOM 197198 / MUCL 43194) TaxID=747089 RepID=A0A2P4QLQ0_RHIID|nr:hypothetical protein GLOIN_2v1766447 [Rhizophagus irregularis DAOM 181602=DAOM 197198]POG78555.1 hypothetical protein GLOIN_2v1766447 [Rhizophagus irregularis DAOM 181602=DAOM 197198]GBC32532.2 hypothetical protein GLOIN_2v1766447 [Rhizophagus irregularis DAOM 181602=DAOM 197198]|eukprot:XP_025185421.1 hypothetical protein GLOIN_2v1766447 [Rhizophagus irregularis DAOM 181602=DAOM 197198]
MDIYDEDREMTPTIDIENEEVDDDDIGLKANSNKEVIIDQPLSNGQIPYSFIIIPLPTT